MESLAKPTWWGWLLVIVVVGLLAVPIVFAALQGSAVWWGAAKIIAALLVLAELYRRFSGEWKK
jgi:hypothetical protein